MSENDDSTSGVWGFLAALFFLGVVASAKRPRPPIIATPVENPPRPTGPVRRTRPLRPNEYGELE
jgi:hypothetical protein